MAISQQALDDDRHLRQRERPVTEHAAYDDEIDLVDLGVALWRRWKLMTVVFICCIGTALAAAFLTPRNYEYKTTVQLAAQVSNSGPPQLLVQPEQAISTLQNSYLPQAIERYARQHNLDPAGFDISVTHPSNSRLIVLSTEGPTSKAAAFKTVEQAAANELINDNKKATNSSRAVLQSQLDKANAHLAELENPVTLKAQIAPLAANQADAQAKLSNIEGHRAVLQTQLSGFAAQRKLLNREIDSLQKFVEQGRAQEQAVAAKTDSVERAMALLVLSKQVQDAAQQLYQLRQTLNVDLPNQEKTMQQQLAQNKIEQQSAGKAVTQYHDQIQQAKVANASQLDQAKASSSALQAQLAQLQDTQILPGPIQNNRPSGPRRKLIVVFGVVAGLVFALLAALIAGYFAAIRIRWNHYLNYRNFEKSTE